MVTNNHSQAHNIEPKRASNFAKLRLLLWKNFLIQFRHYIRTIIEVLLFVYFIAGLFILKFIFSDLRPPENDQDTVMFEVMGLMIGSQIVMSFMFPTINSVRYITIEKEKQLKEAMKIMGLPCWMHWTSWYIRIKVFMIIAISIIVALLKVIIFCVHLLIHKFDKTTLSLGFNIFGLVTAFRIHVCVQYFSDNVLFHDECIFYENEYGYNRFRNRLVRFTNASIIFARTRYKHSKVVYITFAK